jgi:hypothetical protein
MLRVVQPKTPHRPDVFGGKGRKQHADVGHLVRHLVVAKDVAFDDPGGLDLGDVGHAMGEDGVAIICTAIAGEEANQSLEVVLVVLAL